jgi:hypothetical protein
MTSAQERSAAQEATGCRTVSLEFGTPMTGGSLIVLPVYRRGDLRTLRYGLLGPAIVDDELTNGNGSTGNGADARSVKA